MWHFRKDLEYGHTLLQAHGGSNARGPRGGPRYEPDDPLRPLPSPQDPSDVLRVCAKEELTTDGFRLLWFHSRCKAALDDAARDERCRRAMQQLEALQRRLSSPRTRFREWSAVERAGQEILAARQVETLLRVEILEREESPFAKRAAVSPANIPTIDAKSVSGLT